MWQLAPGLLCLLATFRPNLTIFSVYHSRHLPPPDYQLMGLLDLATCPWPRAQFPVSVCFPSYHLTIKHFRSISPRVSPFPFMIFWSVGKRDNFLKKDQTEYNRIYLKEIPRGQTPNSKDKAKDKANGFLQRFPHSIRSCHRHGTQLLSQIQGFSFTRSHGFP